MADLTFDDLLPTSAELQPTHPTLGLLPVKIKLRSTLSPEFTLREIENLHNWKRLDKAEKRADYTQVAKDLEHQAIESASLAIIGWDNDKLMGSTYSPDNAKKLMTDPRFTWLRKQINEFIQTDTNFFRRVEGAAVPSGSAGGAESPAAG